MLTTSLATSIPLKAASGVLVHFASVSGKNITTNRAPYACAKAGIEALTKALAVEWALAGSGVRVLAVAPGLTLTEQPLERIKSGAIAEETLLGQRPDPSLDPAGRDRGRGLPPRRRRFHRSSRGNGLPGRRLRRLGRSFLMTALRYESLAGKVVLVTGASRGIGRGIALGFAEQGSLVLINSRTEKGASDTVEEIVEAGGSAEPAVADVGDSSATQAMIAGIVERHGRLDVLVNNSAINPVVPLIDTTQELWEETQRVNEWALFHCGQPAARQMMTRAAVRSS